MSSKNTLPNICHLPYFIMVLLPVFVYACSNKIVSENPGDEGNAYQDMLTPAYYQPQNNGQFRDEVNQFLYFVRREEFHHPLEDDSGDLPDYYTPFMGMFGAGKGPGGKAEHHPAIDMHIGNGETKVNLYAVHDGYVSTVRNAPKYRHYLSISKNIMDNNGKLVGKLITLYGHIDLELDEAQALSLHGQYVQRGDTISKNLYSGTMGGPHLHLEIRYYRKSDKGTESFYGDPFFPAETAELTEKSAGNWTYGSWDPNAGYGFGNPKNHGL